LYTVYIYIYIKFNKFFKRELGMKSIKIYVIGIKMLNCTFLSWKLGILTMMFIKLD
jgi:hypothetical protein